jgi:hypothetical protein
MNGGAINSLLLANGMKKQGLLGHPCFFIFAQLIS